MSTIDELFAPKFLADGILTDAVQAEMAAVLGADSLRYLPVSAVSKSIGFNSNELCQGCITGRYPTKAGQELYQIAMDNSSKGLQHQRTYEVQGSP